MSGQFAARRAPVPQGTGSAGPLFSRLRLVESLAPLLLLGTVAAQAEGQQAPVELRYGRIAVEQAQPFCWPSAVASPPKFEDVLEKDQVVQVGRTEGDFVQVVLPLGPVGYVSKRYAAADENGVVRSKGAKVSFRYRTVTTEAPVAQLEDGTELCVVGEQDDWWRARVPAIEAWLPKTDVQIGDQTDPQLAAGFAATKAKYETEVNARLEAIAAAKQRAEQDKADAAAVQLVQDNFQKELGKPIGEQQYAPLTETLDKLESGLAEDSGARPMVASLRQRIQTQQWIVEATLLRDSKPVPSEEPVAEPQPKDNLDRFQAIGWLRYESRLGGMGTFFLEKGGLRLHHVVCSSGRYDLSLYVGCEIGVIGPRRRPAGEAFSVLDAERLEVLGHNRD